MNEHIEHQIGDALDHSNAQDIEELLAPFFNNNPHPYKLEDFLEDLEEMDFDEINELCNSIGPVGVSDLHSLLTAAMNKYNKQ
ncbi:hypothetical protein [Halodesulfovibrio aestuarii]|uniref:hypothetical protein n=1 Tax=Halodesulfovibrio aestuarii TaxID=126333 RepID=UPI003D32EE49